MSKVLFLLCPTDCLESNINRSFQHENYFCTSFGNSLNTIEHIRKVVKKYHINQIYIVLSKDNPIVLDALGGQFFSNMRGLQSFYEEIEIQRANSEVLCHNAIDPFTVLSYYLNKKVKELKILLKDSVLIEGKIYNRYDDTFTSTHSELICLEKYSLN